MNHGQATSHDSPPLSPLDYSSFCGSTALGSPTSCAHSSSAPLPVLPVETRYRTSCLAADQTSPAAGKTVISPSLPAALIGGKASKRQATFCLITRNTSETSRTRRRMKLLTYIHLSSEHNVTRSEYNYY